MARLRRRGRGFGDGVKGHGLAPSLGGTKTVAIKAQEDGEEPGADRAGWPEQSAPGNGAFETILNQVIGQIGIARQRPGITPEGRNAGFDLVEEVAQDGARLAYSTARCQTPPTPSPVTSPGALSSFQKYSGI